MPRPTKAEPRKPRPAPSPTAGLNLRQLEIFVAAATAGSMSAAATQLDVTQPAASQAIAGLEAALGATLFDRAKRPPALTLAGSAALVHANEIVKRAQDLRNSVRTDAGGPLPILRIGMLDSFVATAGPMTIDRVRDLAREWTVVSGYADTQLSALAERRVDIVISSDESPPPADIVTLPILSEPFMLVLPQRYRGPTDSMKALTEQLDFIRYGREAHMRSPLEQYLTRQGVQPARRFQFNTTDAVMRMVGGGFGWTIVTPLVFFKSISPMDQVRAVALPGTKPMRRAVVLGMRRGELGRIGTTIQAAAVGTLREGVLPRLAKLLPQFADEIALPRV